MATILIKNGTLFDGSGAAPRPASVFIQNDKIIRVGDLSKQRADVTVDATGAFVMPGFVDINTDSDHYLSLFTDPLQSDFLKQGVTTIMGGNCGSSLAPLLKNSLESIMKWGDPSHVNIDWHTVGEFLSILQKNKLGVNFGTLVGHATIRRGMLGDALRDLTEGELVMFARVLEDAFREGAFGFSTGLSYAHSRGTPLYEIKKLAVVAAKYDRIYATHLRDSEVGILEAAEEAIEVAKTTGVNTEISHLEPRQSFVPLYETVFEAIEKTSSESRIHFDVYPFETLALALYMFLPKWLQEGGMPVMREQILSSSSEERLLEYFKRYARKEIIIGHMQDTSLRFLEGKTIEEFAKNQNCAMPEALLRLMRMTRLSGTLFYTDIDGDALDRAMAHRQAIVASNGASLREGGYKHRRNDWAFPTFFERVEKKKLMPLETAVQKATSLPAEKYRIKQRGLVKEGYYADLAVLASDFKPIHVFVNGGWALKDSIPQRSLSGAVLKRTA